MSELTPDPWALRKEANAHRKARRYSKAIAPYAALWALESGRDAWDGWGYAFCLDKEGRTGEALDVCRTAYRLDPNHQQVRQLYARCVYSLELKGASSDLDRMQRAADGVCHLVQQADEYAPYVVPAVLGVAGELKRRGRYDDVLAWLSRLDAAGLSTQPFEFEQDGRTKQGPSDAQRYWGLRCKALYETGAHTACRAAVADALRLVPRFVNDGDVWLRRLSALSRAAEGEAVVAYDELVELVGKKPAWFIHYDLAQLARDLGRKDDAWRHLLQVLLDRAPMGLRIGAFECASVWLEDEDNVEAARAHLNVVLAVRKAEGWPVKGELRTRAEALEAEATPSIKAAVRALESAWRSKLDDLQPRLRGTVKTVIADGKTGFVEDENRVSYFFQASALRGAQPKVGLIVTFRTAPGFDKKKNRPTTNAVDLRVQG